MNSCYTHLTRLVICKRMMILRGLILGISLSLLLDASGQAKDMMKFRFISPHTSFPDTARKSGYKVDSVLYDATTHYNDNSVLVIVPPEFSGKEKVDLIFWFHGWMNNIDSADAHFELGRQFVASKRNAVLVLPEAAKNAPDSYGGKLEQPGMFAFLVGDVLNQLKNRQVIGPDARVGTITLAGHSGGYSVIAKILQNEDMPVHEVILFDALYSRQFMFMNWIKKNPGNIFINLFTDHGGTAQNSYEFMEQLKKENISFLKTEESTLTTDEIKGNRILFVHTEHMHNDIINHPNNFQLFLVQDRKHR